MKFPIKALSLAVAVALTGAAGMAQAANSNNDLFVAVYDPSATTNNVFVADLGTGSLSTAPTANVNLSSFASWATFNAGVTATAEASLEYFVLSANSITGSGNIGVVGAENGSISFTDMEALNTSVTAVLIGDLAGATSSVFTNSTSTSANSFTVLAGSNDFGLNYGQSYIGTNGSALQFYYGAPDFSAGGLTLLTTTTLNAASSTLNFASATATPEPGTYALMVAGLLAVGAIVRRRSRA